MTQISRLWCALAAIGAGTIHLAVGASAPVFLSVTLVGLGIAELGWGVATLVRGRYLMPRRAFVGALLPLVVWAAAAGLRSTSAGAVEVTVLPVFPMTVATLFSLFVAGSLALARRGRVRQERASDAVVEPAPQGWRFLVALTLGGALVSALTTPALAATDAGTRAVPHGSHSDSGPAGAPGKPHSHH